MSHTPGPWIASHYLDTDEVGVVSDRNQIVVGLSSRLSEADARLIAAAPELLAFVKKIRFEMVQAGWTKWVRESDAIVAKATEAAHV